MQMLEAFGQDLRHGLRLFAKAPGFTLAAVLSIAIGVGANAAMFSIADGLIFRPLAVPDAGGVVMVSAATPAGEIRDGGISYRDYLDLRDRGRSFAGLAASRGVIAGLARSRTETPQARFGLAVTGDYFDVLGVRAAAGRTFRPDEARVPDGDALVVLSHEWWTREFGADPGILGQSIRLAGRDFQVIGVAPEGFTGTSIYVSPVFYVPVTMLAAIDNADQPAVLERRDVRTLDVVGRLAAGVSVTQANQDAQVIARALAGEYPATNREHGFVVRTERDTRFDDFRPAFSLGVILIALALAVLLVACANVAALLTSRAPVRAREMALRLAIGGSRARLVRQQLTEAVLISMAGAAVGLALGYGGIRSFRQFQVASDVGVQLTYAMDRRALAVGVAAAVVCALFSSLLPAWRNARATDLSSTLRTGAGGASGRTRLWGRHGLVASQIALTLVVVTVAVSFYRAFTAAYSDGPGFMTERRLLTTIDTSLARYDLARTEAFYRELGERVASIPGVETAALTSSVPLSQDGAETVSIVPEGFQLPLATSSLSVATARVDERYLKTFGIAVVNGRDFTSGDSVAAPRVAIVSAGMAARYWPGQDPLGKRIRLVDSDEWAEIVGVAADVKFRLFVPASTPFVYLPRQQSPSRRATLVVATQGDPSSIAGAVRAAVVDLDRDMPVLAMWTMEDFFATNAKNLNTVVVRTIGAMGAMGLFLALIGLYSVMAYAVSRRTREVGIRMAVGAKPGAVMRMFVRQGSWSSIVGLAAGLAASVGVGRLLQGLFPGTGGDAVTYVLVVPLIAAVTFMAAYLPARRAARIDPLVALRIE